MRGSGLKAIRPSAVSEISPTQRAGRAKRVKASSADRPASRIAKLTGDRTNQTTLDKMKNIGDPD